MFTGLLWAAGFCRLVEDEDFTKVDLVVIEVPGLVTLGTILLFFGGAALAFDSMGMEFSEDESASGQSLILLLEGCMVSNYASK